METEPNQSILGGVQTDKIMTEQEAWENMRVCRFARVHTRVTYWGCLNDLRCKGERGIRPHLPCEIETEWDWLQHTLTHTRDVDVHAHVCVVCSMLIVEQAQISEGEVPVSSIKPHGEGRKKTSPSVCLNPSTSSSLIISPSPSNSAPSPFLPPFNNSATDQLH